MWIDEAQEAGWPPTLGSPRFFSLRWLATWIIAIVCAKARSTTRLRRAVSGRARVVGGGMRDRGEPARIVRRLRSGQEGARVHLPVGREHRSEGVALLDAAAILRAESGAAL